MLWNGPSAVMFNFYALERTECRYVQAFDAFSKETIDYQHLLFRDFDGLPSVSTSIRCPYRGVAASFFDYPPSHLVILHHCVFLPWDIST